MNGSDGTVKGKEVTRMSKDEWNWKESRHELRTEKLGCIGILLCLLLYKESERFAATAEDSIVATSIHSPCMENSSVGNLSDFCLGTLAKGNLSDLYFEEHLKANFHNFRRSS
ncbi:MAG: hypothetical protein WBA22_18765 [Candidatus Methanofastidiosia archaeon]